MSPYRPHEVEAAFVDDLEGVAVALLDGAVEFLPGPEAYAGQWRGEEHGRAGSSGAALDLVADGAGAHEDRDDGGRALPLAGEDLVPGTLVEVLAVGEERLVAGDIHADNGPLGNR